MLVHELICVSCREDAKRIRASVVHRDADDHDDEGGVRDEGVPDDDRRDAKRKLHDEMEAHEGNGGRACQPSGGMAVIRRFKAKNPQGGLWLGRR